MVDIVKKISEYPAADPEETKTGNFILVEREEEFEKIPAEPYIVAHVANGVMVSKGDAQPIDFVALADGEVLTGMPSGSPQGKAITELVDFDTLTDIIGAAPAVAIFNYDELRAYEGEATMFQVYHREVFGDLGGGTFVVDPSDTTSADDDATILHDGNGRRVKRQIGEEISPHWFDTILANESSDTWAAGQLALDWIAINKPVGAVLKFGARAYWKSATWLCQSPRVIFRGEGMATQIVEMNAAGNAIHFKNIDRPALERMYIWSNTAKAGGTSLVLFDNCHDAYLEDFRCEQGHHGVRCIADWQQYLLYISHGDIGHCDGDGIRVGDFGTLVQGLFVDNVHITACDVGISQFNCSGFQSLHIDIIQCRLSFTTYPYGVIKTGDTTADSTDITGIASTADLNEYGVIVIGDYRGAVTAILGPTSIEVWPPVPDTANDVSMYIFNQCVAGEHVGLVCDTSSDAGMQLFTNGGVVADQKFYYARCGACGVENSTTHGVHIVAAGNVMSEVRDVQFIQLWAEQNGGNGVRIDASDGTTHHIGFFQSSIGDNSLATDNLRDGIYIGYGISHLTIIGGHSSNAPLIAHPNQQRWGLFIEAGPTDYLTIMGFDVTGNVTGGLSNGATGTHNTVIGNPGSDVQVMTAGLTIKDDLNGNQSLTIDGRTNTAGGAAIRLRGDGVTTPDKWLRVHNGILEVINNAFTTVIFSIRDDGMLLTALGAIRLGGTSASFPMIKRSTTQIQMRLADDSDYALVDAASFIARRSNGFMGGKINDPVVAPGAGLAKMFWVAGTNPGTGKLIAYVGTSTTPTTIIDNVGGGF